MAGLDVGATTSSEFFAALLRKDTSTKFKNIPVRSLLVCARKYILPSYLETYHAALIYSLAAQAQNRMSVSRLAAGTTMTNPHQFCTAAV